MKFLLFEQSWDTILNLINSQFFSSLSGALAGAFAGAMAAHVISKNAKEQETLEEQIRGTNAAIMSTLLICNAFLSLKKQQVAPMYQTFHYKKDEYQKALENRVPGSVIHVEADFKTVSLPAVPIDILKKQAYEKLSLRGRPLGLVAAISNAISSFEDAIRARNSVIEQYKRFPPNLAEKTKLDFYFGFPLPDGNVSTEYLDSLEGIYQHTDDAIFYSSLLGSDLEKYGNKLRDRYLKTHGSEIEIVSSLDFKKAESLALMPDAKNYEDWLSIFVEVPPGKKPPWYLRFRIAMEKHLRYAAALVGRA
jgi:hypothetical protein